MLAYRKALLTVAISATLVAPLAGAAAQQPYPGYDAQPPAGYDPNARSDPNARYDPPPGYDPNGRYDPPPPAGYRGADDRYDPPHAGYADDAGRYGSPPPGGYDVPPPNGYDGSQPPPPPPGYQSDPRYAPQVDQDRRYEAYAEDWAQRYCVRSGNNAGAGAVIGGLFGALLGSGLAGRHDRGGGAILGGVAGAAGGAVIGSSSGNATSPGCPPGYVVRREAPAFYYPEPSYVYAAPGWYRPWVFYGGRWTYRPYPYRVWYAERYGYRRPYGAYGRGGWRRRY